MGFRTNLTSKFFTMWLTIFTCGAIAAPAVTYAQSTTSSEKKDGDSKTKVTPKAEQNGKAKSTNKGVAQGLTVAEINQQKESRWGFFFSTSVDRGLDEMADTLSSDNSLSLSYRLDKKSSLGLSAGYSTLLLKRDGDVFANEDADPGRYGFNDTDISYIRPNIWSDKYNRLMFSSGITLPTSRASNRASMNASGRVAFSLRYRPTSRIIISPTVSSYLRHYSYDTSNAFGSSVNSYFGVGTSLSGSYIIRDWLVGSVSYGQTQRLDYNEDWKTVQFASAQLSITATDSLNAFVGYSWSDLVLTNEPLFDDDRSSIYTGVGYAF